MTARFGMTLLLGALLALAMLASRETGTTTKIVAPDTFDAPEPVQRLDLSPVPSGPCTAATCQTWTTTATTPSVVYADQDGHSIVCSAHMCTSIVPLPEATR